MAATLAPRELTIGFLPLVDACLPILALEHGFAEAEGLSLRLVRDMSWATVLDRLLYGHSDAAHLSHRWRLPRRWGAAARHSHFRYRLFWASMAMR